jgi:hypothetical protein
VRKMNFRFVALPADFKSDAEKLVVKTRVLHIFILFFVGPPLAADLASLLCKTGVVVKTHRRLPTFLVNRRDAWAAMVFRWMGCCGPAAPSLEHPLAGMLPIGTAESG